MSTATIMAVAALVGVIGLAALAISTRSQLRRLELRARTLESRLDDDEVTIGAVRGEARSATNTARRAARAAGIELEAPRLPLEPVTGRVVRALAFSSGARRALSRLVSTRRPGRSARAA